MNTATNVVPLRPSVPAIMKPSARVMRSEGITHDKVYSARGTRLDNIGRRYDLVALNPGETSLDWEPVLKPLFSMPFPGSDMLVRAGNSFAIIRPGYEEDPLGVTADRYRIFVHQKTALEIEQSHSATATTPTTCSA
jgi:hypothetical protein